MLLLLVWTALTGCAYRVRIDSVPTGAQVQLADGTTHYAPTDVVARWRPLRSNRVVVGAPGYRTIERVRLIRALDYPFDLILHPRQAFGTEPRREVEFVLVPVHGAAGTWTPEEEELRRRQRPAATTRAR